MGNLLIAWVIIPGLVVAAVVVVFMGIYIVVERSDDYRPRLEAFTGKHQPQVHWGRGTGQGMPSFLARLDRLLSGREVVERLALLLVQSDLHLSVPEFLLIDLLAGALPGGVFLVLRRQLLSGLAAATVGVVLPWVFVASRRQRRIRAFHDQLLDVLALVVGSLRAGHGLTAALDLVSKELNPPASEEFGRVAREVGFGLSQSEALNNLAERMSSEDMQLIITAMNISQLVGGDLSQVLEKISTTIRDRQQVHDEIRVLTTQQRLTSYLLVGLPFGLGLVLAIMNPSWMLRLFAPGWIRLVPATALVLEVVGFIITRRLTRIDV